MSRPLIATTTVSANANVQFASRQQLTVLNNTVIQRVVDLDCVPLLVPNLVAPEHLGSLADVMDGLLLSAGCDVDPASYGAQPQVTYGRGVDGFGRPFHRPDSLRPDPARDAVEIALYRAAKARRVPVLGLCRGMHIINVAEGGTLHQELPESSTIAHELDDDGWINYHELRIEPGTRCAQIVETERYFVSSIHHQAISKLGPELRVAGTAEDGIVELIEHRDDQLFIIGVQGHIEKSTKNLRKLQNLWRAFSSRAHEIHKPGPKFL
ncbi:MAG: gamma-glutamyl-gamma-aminobutyrate hydrolase family protein [Proteobacteria bacterium]|nr:gamma-glutamyl-gamma-aminobutyrate hydrolase family protein [Pseudomonadota bacterium]